MKLWHKCGVVELVLTLFAVVCAPGQGWGQTDERIGTVLAVEGTAEVRAANATAWEPLQFRAAILPNDTVRTATNSKVKVLLRDDSIMTLAERSEMQFTEFILTPQQRRTIVNLALGKVRVVTTKIFGAGSTTEVRTANTVAGVRGTTFVVIFIPPEETDVIALDGVVAVRNPDLPQLEPLPANFRTQILGNAAPGKATELSVNDRQALENDLRLTEHIPTEILPSTERQAAGSIRGEPTASGLAGPLTPPLPSVALVSADLPSGAQDGIALLEQLLARTETVDKAQKPEPLERQGTPVITPDSVQTTTILQQRQPSNIRLTISFPR